VKLTWESRTRVAVLASVAVLAVVTAVTIAVLRDGDSRKAALPSCAQAAVTIARPGHGQLPRALAFPAGTVFTRFFRNRLTRGVPTIEGRMPLDLREAARFLYTELPRAGFRLFLTQERPGEVSSFYHVKGFGGRFTLARLPACEGATSFSVSARPTLLGRGFAQ
jgi:hypothetical protein